MAALLLVIGSFLFGPSPLPPLLRGWNVAHECLQLNATLQSLHADNEQLAQYVKVAPTPEGRELLARGRYNMVKRGEWLVVLDEKPPPEPPKPTGLRALVGSVHETIDEEVASWRTLRKLMSNTRSSKPSGG